MRLRAATRGSPLARWQTEHVAALLRRTGGHDVEPVVVSTAGDRDQGSPLHAIGGQGVFVKDVQQAVLDGDADLAVHSAKDLPSTDAPGLVIAAVPARGDARDALVGFSLEEIPVGGRVGTGSVRRRAQLAALRPDLTFGELRGNIATRLDRLRDFHAVVVAVAALHRLGRHDAIAEALDVDVLVPQVAQGAIAVECRADDDATRAALAAVEDDVARRAVDAERAFLAAVGGGCDLPVGAHATVGGDGRVALTALLASLDGHVVLRERDVGRDAAAVGAAVATQLLDGAGGRWLLDER